jgi:hypothetical protein
MSRDPLISVVVTNYNYGRFLSRAIDSVAPPVGGSVEVLVVDDGSYDCSASMIQALSNRAEERLASFDTIFLPANYGKMHALNVAIPRLRGQLPSSLMLTTTLHHPTSQSPLPPCKKHTMQTRPYSSYTPIAS